MKALVLSDLHLDFHKDGGQGFINSLETDVDLLILAGDLSSHKILAGSIGLLVSHFKDTVILFVAGNHEYYGHKTPSPLITVLDEATVGYTNFFWLDTNSTTGPEMFGAIKVIGTPLWFRDTPMNSAFEYMLNDFNQIAGYRDWVYRENRKSIDYLSTHVDKDTVVITHHVPTRQSIKAEYLRQPLNRFFLCDVEDIIYTNKPRIWIHGHTHNAYDYKLENTRIICNPLGYPYEITRFDPYKIIDI